MPSGQTVLSAPGPRRQVKADAVAKEPYLVWNAFVDLLAMEEYETLSPIQRRAHLAFWYNTEVLNGGHHQYFENSAGRRSHEAVDALSQLGLKCQAEILGQAIVVRGSEERPPRVTTEEFLKGALDHEFESHDKRHEECSPTIEKRLELYLKEHQDEFVIVEGAT